MVTAESICIYMFGIHLRPVTNDTEPMGHVRGLYGWLSVAAQVTHKMPPLGVYGQLMGVMGSVNRPSAYV